MVGQAHRLAARVVLGGLLLFAVYHLVRDVATTFFGVHVGVVDVAHRAHAWCRPVCDYVTMPLELFNIVTIAFVLCRVRLGALACINVATVPLWLLFWLLP
jgi:hypothetical protein